MLTFDKDGLGDGHAPFVVFKTVEGKTMDKCKKFVTRTATLVAVTAAPVVAQAAAVATPATDDLTGTITNMIAAAVLVGVAMGAFAMVVRGFSAIRKS